MLGIVEVQIINEFGLLYGLRGGMNLHNSGPLEANPANILHPFYAKLINMLEHFIIIIQREFCLGTQLLFCKSNVWKIINHKLIWWINIKCFKTPHQMHLTCLTFLINNMPYVVYMLKNLFASQRLRNYYLLWYVLWLNVMRILIHWFINHKVVFQR